MYQFLEPQTSRGTIEIILGPMFSGKSTELLRRLRRQEIAEKKVLLVKHKLDERYEGSNQNVVTHDLNSAKATLISANLSQDLLLSGLYKQADVVGIDEA